MGHYDNFWKTKAELERQLTTEEQLTSAYESLLPVFQALICYFTTDMVIKADQFRTYLSKRSREQKKEIILENKFIRVLPNKVSRTFLLIRLKSVLQTFLNNFRLSGWRKRSLTTCEISCCCMFHCGGPQEIVFYASSNWKECSGYYGLWR